MKISPNSFQNVLSLEMHHLSREAFLWALQAFINGLIILLARQFLAVLNGGSAILLTSQGFQSHHSPFPAEI